MVTKVIIIFRHKFSVPFKLKRTEKFEAHRGKGPIQGFTKQDPSYNTYNYNTTNRLQ